MSSHDMKNPTGGVNMWHVIEPLYPNSNLLELVLSRRLAGRTLVYKLTRKGDLLLTLINTVLYFPYLLFNFSVIFFKPRNSKPLT